MTADELTRVTAERDSLLVRMGHANSRRDIAYQEVGRLRGETERVTAERDAAVAALARLHAAASAMVREYEVAAPDWWPNAIGPLEEAVEATQGDAGGEVASAGSDEPNGVQNGTHDGETR